MPQHGAPQRPRAELQSCPGAPAVPSIREQAAALRAAQEAGTQSRTIATPEALDALFARRRAEALAAAEQRWGLDFSAEEPVPVPGSDWEWRIEAQAGDATAADADTLGPDSRAEAPASPAGHTQSRSHERASDGQLLATVPGSPVKKKRSGTPDHKAARSCGAQTRQRRLLGGEEVAPPSLKAFWPAR